MMLTRATGDAECVIWDGGKFGNGTVLVHLMQLKFVAKFLLFAIFGMP